MEENEWDEYEEEVKRGEEGEPSVQELAEEHLQAEGRRFLRNIS